MKILEGDEEKTVKTIKIYLDSRNVYVKQCFVVVGAQAITTLHIRLQIVLFKKRPWGWIKLLTAPKEKVNRKMSGAPLVDIKHPGKGLWK